MPRILFAGLFHETHSFVDETTGLDAFRRRDAAGIMARRGDLSVVDGFLGVAEREGWMVKQQVKLVRLFTRSEYHADSAEDNFAYAALLAEAKGDGR